MENRSTSSSDVMDKSAFRAWARTPSAAEVREALQAKEAIVLDLTKGQRQEVKLKKEITLLVQELQRTLSELEQSRNDAKNARQQLKELRTLDTHHQEQQSQLLQLREEVRLLHLELEELGGPLPDETEPARHSEIIDINGTTMDTDLDPRPSSSFLNRSSFVYARDDTCLNGHDDPRTGRRAGPHLRRHSTGTDSEPRLLEQLPKPAPMFSARDEPLEEDCSSSQGDDRWRDTGET